MLCCNQVDRDSLLSFNDRLISTPPLNWSSSPDCCRWEGVLCNTNGTRVTRLSLPGRALSGTLTPFLGNLSFLSPLNLSTNNLSGPLSLSLPASITALDLSSNHFDGSIDPLILHRASGLISFNVSNNSFAGLIPTSLCEISPLVEILDFSANQFSGELFLGFGRCARMQVLRAGFNSLSGWIPSDIYSVKTLREIALPNNRFSGPVNNSIALLSNLTILELHVNELSGEIPADIGLLCKLEQLLLHTNNLSGNLPPSLTAGCSALTTLILRNNYLGGEISDLDWSKLQRLEAIDLGNNSFVGQIPASLCLCRSLTAVRLAYNGFVGELPACIASLRSLAHVSLSDNYLSNVAGALKILRHCDDLAVLFLSRCFHDEMMPDDDDLQVQSLDGFQNLQILTLGGCALKGQIPSWIARLRKLKVLNLSYNRITGPIPTWLGDMPSLFVVNFTQNFLSGDLPREICRLPALMADNTSSDLSYLALPFLFDSLQYNRLFNLPRGLKVGGNNLSGNIPEEIGQLRLLHILDLNNNGFNGSIPTQLSSLANLERLDMSGNRLSGEIPASLVRLHFLSWFSVANNDLRGEIPRGGQFDTFALSSFEGNPKLCGAVLGRLCSDMARPVGTTNDEEEEEEGESSWRDDVPFGIGYFVGFFAVSITLVFYTSFTTSCVVSKCRNPETV